MSEKLKRLSEIDFTPAGKVFPSPSDWRDQFIYFLLIDRFSNGDKKIPAYDPATAVNDRDDSDGEQWQGSAATVQATGGRHAVKVDLGPHEAAVLKLSVQD